MVLALVTWSVSGSLSPVEVRELCERAAPRFQSIPGLMRKYFLNGDGEGGGAYEWRSRQAAEAYYDATWRARIRDTYGAEPKVVLYDVPCVVDNATQRILFPEPE
jgi:hypothetical protein